MPTQTASLSLDLFSSLAGAVPSLAAPLHQRLFDGAAMGIYPWLARTFGYTFRVGASEDLRRDGHAVLDAVWSGKGITPPADVAWYGERYDRATTWIVAYHRNRPVGVMGLMDLRIASLNLDLERRLLPAGLNPATTRELGRLAILPKHRGKAQLVMVGLLREMLAWSKQNRVEMLFSCSLASLFRVFARFNPSARLVDAPMDTSEDPIRERYHEKLRAYGRGQNVLYTFEVAGASPWGVFSRFLARLVRRSAES